MKNYSFPIKAAIVVFALAAGVLFYFLHDCSKLDCITFENYDQYRLETSYEDNRHIFRALFEHGNNLLRAEIRPTEKAEADEAVQVQITRTKGLFEDASAPYPGEISDVIGCSDLYKPDYKSFSNNGVKIDYFEGYLNERLVLGSCSEDQARYHVLFAMFYCSSQNKFYQLEYIQPTQEYRKDPKSTQRFLNSISCDQ